MDIINKTYSPNQVKPPNLKNLYKTSRKAQIIIIFWSLGGWRYHAFVNITKDDFGQEENGFIIVGNDSKYGPSEDERETRSIPANIANLARAHFPVPKNYIRDFILEPLNISSHAFRRLLAILLRRELAKLKWSQIRVNRSLPAINYLLGWAPASKSFNHYSGDWELWPNLVGPKEIELYINYLISYDAGVAAQLKEARKKEKEKLVA